MPHFVIHCSSSILSTHSEEVINEQLHLVAQATGLFAEGDIKVRVKPFKTYLVGNKTDDFIHVFAHIMSGRTREQKANLAKLMVTKLTEMFPHVAHVAMNVDEFEQATYCNKNML